MTGAHATSAFGLHGVGIDVYIAPPCVWLPSGQRIVAAVHLPNCAHHVLLPQSMRNQTLHDCLYTLRWWPAFRQSTLIHKERECLEELLLRYRTSSDLLYIIM